jgi:inorganic triphosphatase YgiF
MGREFELKYKATPAVLSALAVQYGPGREIRMETTYFDTPNGLLSARHMTLRLRRENEATVCTLKTPLPDGSRGEWECPAADISSGIASLLALGAPQELKTHTSGGVAPVCGALFTRIACDVPTADGLAELALDSGVLLGGSKEIPLCEVELELKTGSEAALLALAQSIAVSGGLAPEHSSKFRRALALAQGE